MSRYVLLGLAGKDVDVLSRLSRLEPRPEVLVVHPDPGALILRLADVAQMPALTEPPRARADDVVVVPSVPYDEVAEWAQSWRDVGARIVLPDGVERAGETLPSAVHAAVSAQAAAAASALSTMTPLGRAPAANVPPAVQEPSKPPEEKPVTSIETEISPMGNGSDRTPDAVPETAASGLASEPQVGPAGAWESPEATFRYLIEQALGRDAAITLWWNGGVDAWVPWVWTGATPGARPHEPGDSLRLDTECGRFLLSGAGERGEQLNLVAMARVAEDMALRDLMRWRREVRALGAHGLPDPQAAASALSGWIVPVMKALDAAAALVWRREDAGWRLLHAEGEGLGLDGSFLVPAGLFAATFEAENSPWRRWEPSAGLCVHLQVKGDDPRWPLRLRRVELVLAGGETAW